MADLFLADEAATAALGRRLAGALEPGDVVFLEGDLGSGKSTLARACLQALAGAAITVPSPTFTLVQTYDFADLSVFHVDLYRLAPGTPVDDLALEEALETGALLIEWPDRLAADAFPERLAIRLAWPERGAGRCATLDPGTGWRARRDALLAR
ncbi:MAG: tRNA (adenosine(37)-N6)-threonylcarbamoyltransferase complex ATPase subunit type 1 TsaE [Alphaproteobacteria bacterium]